MIDFNERYNLIGKNDKLLIAVSGGIDSIALLFCMIEFRRFGYFNRMRVIHINHNSRSGQDEEEFFVRNFCRGLGIKFLTKTLSGFEVQANFENRAREKRYEAFYEFAEEGEKIVLAHHIDDSFEWTMLQSLRSASIEGLIGIPVKNGRIVRPFMCVTKQQIYKFAEYFDLPFIEDPTNESIKYERNFIRHQVIPAFSDRYRKYLKHYVYRHNEVARRLGLHLIEKNKSSFNIVYSDKSVLIYNLSPKLDTSGIESLIIKGLRHLNPNSRGVVSEQLKKLAIALKNNKVGPLLFSGGIYAYLDYNQVLLTELEDNLTELTDLFLKPKKMSFDRFLNESGEFIADKNNQLAFPFLVKVEHGNLDVRKFDTSFNKNTTQKLKEQRVRYYTVTKLIREWAKKRNRHRVLEINFLR